MEHKPTYEELGKRAKGLEEEMAKRKKDEEALFPSPGGISRLKTQPRF
ncbi:MAG: hypothetical protein QF466_03305 [Desulfobacterales bacterium]|mgnify:CR=1 FL=1|jgi:hypothetical protein|nr:hypothetical protein [Desulfobacterales bacterium]MDP6684084.1 hypothetical protein [Desulfobacterales bacterium]MDP6806293.1 hypothetical protein [Desulfobacterales bacterium]|tara:strand:+ start:100139 stop:100282 length:144 start_codon:yes stop_codon:yes gene_type:complete